jgi:hypothetical protein
MQEARDITLSSAEGFRVSGNFIRSLPGGDVVAAYSRHQWNVQDSHFSRYDCIDRCCLFFRDMEGGASESFGPFDVMHVADGTMYGGDKLFAKFVDESVLWHSYELDTYWPSLFIVPFEQSPNLR